jgi:hypothetical protein
MVLVTSHVLKFELHILSDPLDVFVAPLLRRREVRFWTGACRKSMLGLQLALGLFKTTMMLRLYSHASLYSVGMPIVVGR